MLIILHCAFVMISLATNVDDEPGKTSAFEDETTTTSSLKKVNKTNQVQDEIGMLPPLVFSAALNTTTVSTASVSIVTELTMTTTPHQTDDHRGTFIKRFCHDIFG